MIPDPGNYLAGSTPGQPTALPDNILLFSRKSAARRLGSAHARHHHHRFVLLVALRGTGRVLLDAESRFLGEGEALLFFPYQYHAYLDITPQRICWLFMTFESASPEWLEPLRNAPPRPLHELEVGLLSELATLWLTPEQHPLLPLHLGLLLARLAAQEPGRLPRPPVASAAAELMAEVNRYVLPRLEAPLSVGEVAMALGMSESHLRARYREAVGTSLGRHLRDLRMQRAASLLHTSGHSISEVAQACGFDSLYAFSRAFKTAQGVSPRAYRAHWKSFASVPAQL